MKKITVSCSISRSSNFLDGTNKFPAFDKGPLICVRWELQLVNLTYVAQNIVQGRTNMLYLEKMI